MDSKKKTEYWIPVGSSEEVCLAAMERPHDRLDMELVAGRVMRHEMDQEDHSKSFTKLLTDTG